MCNHCGKTTEPGHNYCNWDCMVEQAKKLGGKIIAPNNLPIKCIKADNTMLEHEVADHPDYKFPVDVEFVGEKPKDLETWDHSYENESQGLIYADRSVALTLYECTYQLWWLRDGTSLGGREWYRKWRLTDESIRQIKRVRNEP